MSPATPRADDHTGKTLPLILLPLIKLSIHLFTYQGYGWFRDEFYYLACAARPAFGYVDQPPLSILVLKLATGLLGESLFAVRMVPALAGALTVLLVGLIAREIGGGRFAQVLAMTSACIAPAYLGLNHFYSMNAFDILLWTAAAWVLVRVLKDPAPGRWILLGLVLGLGLQNKISVLWLGFGIFAGLVLAPDRRVLATRWPWIAGTVAAALFLPHILWQVAHGWPTLEFIRNATGEKMVAVSPVDFLMGQLEALHYLNAPIWLAGLVFYLLLEDGRKYRALGWTYLAVFTLLIFSGSSRAGYLSPAYGWLFAAGGVVIERITRGRAAPGRRPSFSPGVIVRAGTLIVLVAAGALIAPFALPVLPVDTYIAYAGAAGVRPSTAERKELSELPQFYADMHGWESIVETVAAVYRSLPPADREKAAIFTPNYGVAGAVDLLGRRYGLPRAISGHNNYWFWGPGEFTGEVVLVFGGSRQDWEPIFDSVEAGAVTDCGYCMPYENNNPIWVGRGLIEPLSVRWERTKHFD
jgi:hypothetical protein